MSEVRIGLCGMCKSKVKTALEKMKVSDQVTVTFFSKVERENKSDADAIREMLKEAGEGLNPDWLKHFHNYADNLESKDE